MVITVVVVIVWTWTSRGVSIRIIQPEIAIGAARGQIIICPLISGCYRVTAGLISAGGISRKNVNLHRSRGLYAGPSPHATNLGTLLTIIQRTGHINRTIIVQVNLHRRAILNGLHVEADHLKTRP